jgi:2-desacetyl-2-hydroxyethyl bacteriochlorophyllide A dehydrogenase
MRAARCTGVGEPLLIQEVPVPELGPLDVLVKVEACGICLSDVHLLDGSIPPVKLPVTPGHESFGTVFAAGEYLRGWDMGQRVSLMGGRNCGKCVRCKTGRMEQCLYPEIMGFHFDGAWADYVLVPFYACSPVPDGVEPEQAAILADAVATPYGALTRTAELNAGESVGLWGIGGLGTHAVQLARLLGAGLVIAVDPMESARKRALELGADEALDPTEVDVPREMKRITGGIGLDVAVDLVGANAVLKEGVASLGRGGRAVMVGLSLDPIELGPGILLGVQSQSVRGHLGYAKEDLDELVGLLARGRLDLSGSISDVIPLEDVADGVRRLAEKEGDPVRIIVKP